MSIVGHQHMRLLDADALFRPRASNARLSSGKTAMAAAAAAAGWVREVGYL